MRNCLFNIGDIVEIADKLDPENIPTEIATVKGIEWDDELEAFWLYLIANEEVLNVQLHPRYGYYWDLCTDDCQFIRLLSRATIS